MRFLICSLKLGAGGFGGTTRPGEGLATGFAGYLFSNCRSIGAGLPSSGGIKGESELIVIIRSFAVTGCPFIVPTGVWPSTRGGRGRVCPTAFEARRYGETKQARMNRAVAKAWQKEVTFFMALMF